MGTTAGWRKSDFYPRPPRGGRPYGLNMLDVTQEISIHALREEGDLWARPLDGGNRISIHALREEGDPKSEQLFTSEVEFLSTPSARRATGRYARHDRGQHISIHALREEGDSAPMPRHCTARDFYPRPPRGGRRRQTAGLMPGKYFYPRPPRGGRHLPDPGERDADDFYPRPPRGGRPWAQWVLPLPCHFYPRPPRGGRPFHLL